jgi:hypothetical protein
MPESLTVLKVGLVDSDDNEASVALQDLLLLTQDLRELEIDLVNVKRLPSAESIRRHRKHLMKLYVHCDANGPEDDSKELYYTGDDFTSICTSCVHLTQLSCAWPETNILAVSPSPAWQVYESACSKLLELVTLHISTWPSVEYANTKRPCSHTAHMLPYPTYMHLLRAFATRAFDTITNPSRTLSRTENEYHQLRIVAFGFHNRVFSREESVSLAVYLRSTSYDAEGRSQVSATPLKWGLRRFIEPCSDILSIQSALCEGAIPPTSNEGRPVVGEVDDDSDNDGWG